MPVGAAQTTASASATVPMPRPVPNRAYSVATASAAAADVPGAPRESGASGGNLFNGLFSSNGGEGSKAASFARALGFGNDDSKVTTTASTSTHAPIQMAPRQASEPLPVPRARPQQQASRPIQVARPAPQRHSNEAARADDDGKAEAKRILSDKAEPAPRRTVEAQASTQQAQAPAAAAPRPASGASLMKGAQPVVPTGSFENRWPPTFR
jgi:hypothetical protein